MGEPKLYLVVLAGSTSRALRAEKLLHQAGIVNKLIPVPRHIASDCGVCLRIERADEDKVRQILKAAGIEVEVYPLN
jgi:hypothetical protein